MWIEECAERPEVKCASCSFIQVEEGSSVESSLLFHVKLMNVVLSDHQPHKPCSSGSRPQKRNKE